MWAVVLQLAGCLGLGGWGLAALGLRTHAPAPLRAVLAFPLGMGLWGWLLFWPGLVGWFTPAVMAAMMVPALAGLALLPGGWPRWRRPGPVTGLALLVLLAAMALGLPQALSPPVDADTLAYHYDLPRRFLEAGRIFFTPRAVDGATPLLIQMTYASILGLGGEGGLGLWAWGSSWGLGALILVLSRHSLSPAVAVILTVLVMTTPAVLYGAGTGQVEVRLALFVLLCAVALGRWWQGGPLGWLVLAGLAAGFFMGGKYTGLLFAVAADLVVLAGLIRRMKQGGRLGGALGHALIFGVSVLIAGGQWYGLNWAASGDPVFPMLFSLLGPDRVRFWDGEIDAVFRSAFPVTEMPLAHTIPNLLAYPVLATFAPLPAFDAGRVGLGPVAVMMAPFALAAAWAARRRLWQSAWMPTLGLVLGYYGLWFFLGGSQRVRHLLPLYPLFLLLVAIAVNQWGKDKARRCVLGGAMAVVLAVQMGGALINARWYVSHWTAGRDQYYADGLPTYPLAQWANQHLGPTDKILITARELSYLLNVPFFFAHGSTQNQVVMATADRDIARFWRQIRAQGITHLAGIGVVEADLERLGCAAKVASIPLILRESRTLGGAGIPLPMDVQALTPATCPLETDTPP